MPATREVLIRNQTKTPITIFDEIDVEERWPILAAAPGRTRMIVFTTNRLKEETL